ncbi:diguanylate cyclase (GGDEF)-like protein [Saccharopolyspora lacisalsi]|uniref:Diguanylate cyclase (GGDEF)-like protein n=1 Tax=Halosaccharopolyspora lacisalsi TaxID=1000566 RepID=A0A839DSS9_9PSEU|nr:GGDEF domain-containing protein [Halosaccharopolyspora lacisalsi]MBA8824010.1 diguanylate cyclase (GGDEF)-like protein [Halosaccharopolyspora lacisalsi]
MTGKQPWFFVAVSVAVVDLAVIVLVLSGSMGPEVSPLTADLTGVVGTLAAAAAFAWTGWYQAGDERRWRWLMVLALAWWVAGHAMWTWYRSIDPKTFPNVANALYLGLPVFAFFALRTMVRKDRGEATEQGAAPRRGVVMLDGFIVAGSSLALSWEITVDAVRRADDVRVGRLLMVTTYTVADLVLIVIAILFAITLHSMLRFPLAWLVAGLIAIGFSDVVYIYTISTATSAPHVADVGYMSGPIMLLLAALAPNRRFSQRGPRISLLFLPYVPLAAVCAFTVFTTVSTGVPEVSDVYGLVGVVALVVVRQVVTLRQLNAAQQQLTYQATHDPLTGVSNRAHLLFHLDRALAQVQQQPRSLGLLYADLDNFKEINDTLGHEAGDTVLRVVAARLGARIRGADTLARMGGDEFVILLNPVDADPYGFGQRIRSAFHEPVQVGDIPCAVSASIGYVGLNTSDTPDQALVRADEAMYRAKHAGRNGITINVQLP